MQKGIIYIGHKHFPCLVALTPEEQEQGLMFKKPPVHNLAFCFNYPQVRKFWMKNTLAPLDIVFCFESKIIEICEGKPHSTEMIGPNKKSDLILEFPLGTCSKHEISVGAPVTLKTPLRSSR